MKAPPPRAGFGFVEHTYRAFFRQATGGHEPRAAAQLEPVRAVYKLGDKQTDIGRTYIVLAVLFHRVLHRSSHRRPGSLRGGLNARAVSFLMTSS